MLILDFNPKEYLRFRMRVSIFVRDGSPRMRGAACELAASIGRAGLSCAGIFRSGENVPGQTDMVLSLGGDGTLLSLLPVIGDSGIPVLGVNYGRMGFLSSASPDEAVRSLAAGDFVTEERALLGVSPAETYPFALNELSVHRSGAAMLGVVVTVDGTPLPAYWADGLLVATSSGSTAYSLSVGGPIVFPGSDVVIISPIAPHNLNVRPVVVPASSKIGLSFISRDPSVVVSLDNRSYVAPSSTVLGVCRAPFQLRLVRVPGGEFINALTGKLFWGYDVRNGEG